MQSRKYPSKDEAIAYLESKGELKFWGRIDADICLYTFIHESSLYRLYVYEDGLVEIRVF